MIEDGWIRAWRDVKEMLMFAVLNRSCDGPSVTPSDRTGPRSLFVGLFAERRSASDVVRDKRVTADLGVGTPGGAIRRPGDEV